MRYLLLAVLLLTLACSAMAGVADWKVATVNGANQFSIWADGTGMQFFDQPNNLNAFWFENSGSRPDVLATYTTLDGYRHGSKTYAVTNIAAGQKLNTLKVSFDYSGGVPYINLYITDGRGHYAIWYPGSNNTVNWPFVTNVPSSGGWTTSTFDMTAGPADDAGVTLFENSGIPATWGAIKNCTIAGPYDYQRSPSYGWSSWGSAFANVNATWNAFVIRNATTNATPPSITDVEVDGKLAKRFLIDDGGMKAAWATSALDGKKVRDIPALSIDRVGITGGAPYINIWVTDPTQTKYAVLAYGTTDWNMDWNTLKTKPVLVYESSDQNWLANRNYENPAITFKDFADYTILPPTAAKIQSYLPAITGAPRELGTDKAYGINWVFGDTGNNYVSGNGYVTANPSLALNSPDYTNGAGVAVVYGDTVGSYSGNPFVRNLIVDINGTPYGGVLSGDQSAPRELADSAPNRLSLDATSIYVKKNSPIVVDMNVANLLQEVKACQALLGYDSTMLNAGTVAAGGGVWDELIYESWNLTGTKGKINTAIGVNGNSAVGTTAPGTVATISLSSGTNEGVTQMVFLPDVSDVEGTYLSNMNAEFISPSKVNSTNIYIDSTAPVITAPANISVPTDANQNYATVTVATPEATDAVSGVASVVGVRSDTQALTANYPYGVTTITWTATDKCSNDSIATTQTVTVTDNVLPVIASATASPSLVKNQDVTITAAGTDNCPGTLTWEYKVGNGYWKSGLAVPNSELAEGVNTLFVKVTDVHGNVSSEFTVSNTVTKDTTAPTATLSVTQNGVAIVTAIQGAVNIAVVPVDGTVTSVTVTGPSALVVTGTYSVEIVSGTTNGDYTVTAVVADAAGNETTKTATFSVNKNQISGTVSTGFVGTGTRAVTFVLNGSDANTMTAEVDKDGAYKLVNVIDGVTTISAKTAWTLRQKLTGLTSTDGQTLANFTLLGGDVNNSNSINILDYTIVKTKWNVTGPVPASSLVADVDGDGVIGTTDYNIMKGNWFKTGHVK